MIQLHRDYLVFQTSQGQLIPCSAELVAVELIGDSMELLDPELVRQAAAAVLHYFNQDLGRQTVTPAEFSTALEQALTKLGIIVQPDTAVEPGDIQRYDLRQLAADSGRVFELSFFPRLREELRARLGHSPKVLHFCGLRPCVKQLAGARQWSRRCQALNDQIVEFLRECLRNEAPTHSCDLVIR